jgi:hypothetical protein
MPKPNPLNPVCETCGKYTTYNQTLVSGAKEYRCRRHKPNYVCYDSDRGKGRPPILGDRPLTDKELRERWKQNDPEGFKESQKRRNKKRKK